MPRPKTKPRAAEKDALTLLKEDHDTVRELLAELEEAEGKKRLATLRNIEQELKVHTKIEADFFYPAFREVSEKEEATELYSEALVEHHAEEEEKQMFPRARRLMEKEQLLELGRQLAEAKQALLGSKGKAFVTA